MRPLGHILLDMEELIDEMVDDHDLQWGDIRSNQMQHLRTHRPDAQEEYVTGGHPIEYYGPIEAFDHDKAMLLLFMVLEEYKAGRPRRKWKDLMEEVGKFMKENILRSDNG